MKTFIYRGLLCAVAMSAGCQSSHQRSAGEAMLPAPTTSPDSAAPTTPAVPPAAGADQTATPPAVVPPVAAAPETTTPATTAVVAPEISTPMTLTRQRTMFVAADADEASRLRNWPLSTNYYPSGHVIAGPTYRITPPQPKTGSIAETYTLDFLQTLLTIPQSLVTPIWAFKTPPGTAVEYHGEQVPPSYTVDDVLPFYTDEKVPGMVDLKR